ncbi:L,D-transpeptidase family protein [Pontibacter vulgaris]|uniref:L,D-transpeptidase family protein n=1 Tax=Pontibacter vulgaris TaxID=2905679 RepID=UPI001FA6F23D|nr:L,D-transpeptidase family protein [Pontibacter vulgaris]
MYRILMLLWLLPVIPAVQAQDVAGKVSVYIAQKERMQQALFLYQRLVDTNNWHTFPVNLKLQSGDTSRYILPLQENLLQTGDLSLDNATQQPAFTNEITRAVRRFQERHALKADGIIGPKTIAALNITPEQRLEQLKCSYDDWIAATHNLKQPYLLVNIPDYTLQVIDSNKTVLKMRVIVGKKDHQTRVVKSEMTTVVFNPSWNIPRSIAAKEILPILKRNPGYLYKKRMQLFQPSPTGFVRTNPWRVNWKKVTEDTFNYKIVQRPGSINELGRIKFLFKTNVNQYLHDTPDKDLFKYDNRSFSHGCIRLEQPMALADYLLKHRSGYSDKMIAKFKTDGIPDHYIRVKKSMPLLIAYQTAWVDDNMRVQFREDVYGFERGEREHVLVE